ncbi:DUF3795 domain-containing protein [Methanoculleus chikugoensis]|uniref:DUF3795 domain-containing protein n=1 Tax=Methanoculleus chikugoensis TaxID=118126 RepID=A0ABN5XG28_9EURY|nr:DUF3795 domain-containing protein [Methanoculleus chikugoensis]BBL67705.1 hypothetical protein MchiMG62_08860 [Methanoculleus chikugoensis]
MTHLSPLLIAPCGINCGLCIGYLREKNRCPGCRTEDAGRLNAYCARCGIRQCEDRTGEYCYECAGYPCTRLKHLDRRYTKYRTSVLDNLREIREQGVTEFVELEKVRWTCPQCGNILSMHRDRCLHCGRTW